MGKKKEEHSEKENFLWHKVSDEEKEKIRADAQKIMADFGKSLEKIKEEGFIFVEQGSGMREEKEPLKTDLEFKNIIFENGLRKNKESVLAEKGSWV